MKEVATLNPKIQSKPHLVFLQGRKEEKLKKVNAGEEKLRGTGRQAWLENCREESGNISRKKASKERA